jgi:hypothetical protein
MNRKLITLAIASLMAFGSTAAISVADGPGPNGNNEHGLCTAYFNGQKKGHDKHDQPGPFQALEDVSREHANNDGKDKFRVVSDFGTAEAPLG